MFLKIERKQRPRIKPPKIDRRTGLFLLFTILVIASTVSQVNTYLLKTPIEKNMVIEERIPLQNTNIVLVNRTTTTAIIKYVPLSELIRIAGTNRIFVITNGTGATFYYYDNSITYIANLSSEQIFKNTIYEKYIDNPFYLTSTSLQIKNGYILIATTIEFSEGAIILYLSIPLMVFLFFWVFRDKITNFIIFVRITLFLSGSSVILYSVTRSYDFYGLAMIAILFFYLTIICYIVCRVLKKLSSIFAPNSI